MAEDYAQIQPDSTGAVIRTYNLTTLVSGVPTAVEMQIVGISDAQGRVLTLVDGEWQDAVLARLDTLIELLAEAFQ